MFQIIDFKLLSLTVHFLFQPKQVDVFSAIGKSIGDNGFPACVKEILKYTAINSIGSLSKLNKETILDIEKCINESNKSVISGLNCCHSETYQNQDTFRFLPGHKCLLLSIPAILTELKDVKQNNNKRSFEFKKLLTPTEMADLLVNKLNQHLQKCNVNVKRFQTKDVTDLKTVISNNAVNAKCKISCVQCSSQLPVSYNGCWATSNVLRHVKSHLISKSRGSKKCKN